MTDVRRQVDRYFIMAYDVEEQAAFEEVNERVYRLCCWPSDLGVQETVL